MDKANQGGAQRVWSRQANLRDRGAGLGWCRKITWRAAVLCAVLASVTPFQAQAQDAPEHVCTMYSDEPDADGLTSVIAGCWGTGIELGKAEHFESVTNAALGATIVKLERADETRVLLLRALPNGAPIVENLNSVLAASAGRSLLGNIEGLSVDLTQFGNGGLIAVEPGVSSSGPIAERSLDQELGSGDAKSFPQGDVGRDAQFLGGEGGGVALGQIDIGAMIASDPAGAAVQRDQ